MSGNKSRRKGHNFERSVCRRLQAAGYDAKRNLSETRDGNTGDVIIDAPLAFQLKCYAKQAPWRQAYREAKQAASITDYPVAVTKENNTQAMAHLSLVDFIELLGLLRAHGAF